MSYPFRTITNEDWARMFRKFRHAQPMKTYRIRFSTKGADQVADRQATNPVAALGGFHMEMQVLQNIEPSDYKVTSLALFYNEDATGNGRGRWIESLFDIPRSPNPDLTGQRLQKNPLKTEALPFFEETKGQGKLAE